MKNNNSKLRIKEVLKEKGLTINHLACKMNINRVNVSKIIHGNPTVKTLSKIADILEVSLKDLIYEDEISVVGKNEYEYDFKSLTEGKYAWNPLTNGYLKYTNQTTKDFDIVYFYKGKLILLEALIGYYEYEDDELPYLKKNFNKRSYFKKEIIKNKAT